MIKRRIAENRQNGEAFARIIRGLKEYAEAKVVMVYMPIKGESDVTGILGDSKVFVTAVTENEDMYAAKIGEMTVGQFGISEPLDKTVFDKEKIDVVLVPGVAFDKKGNRIGFGKGYYDRFLKNMSAVKIGVCHSFQLLEEAESGCHDVKMDMIVTEDGVWSSVNTL